MPTKLFIGPKPKVETGRPFFRKKNRLIRELPLRIVPETASRVGDMRRTRKGLPYGRPFLVKGRIVVRDCYRALRSDSRLCARRNLASLELVNDTRLLQGQGGMVAESIEKVEFVFAIGPIILVAGENDDSHHPFLEA